MDEKSQDTKSSKASESINLKDPQVAQSINTDSGNVESPKTQSPNAFYSVNWKDLELLAFPKWYVEECEADGFLTKIISTKRTRYEDYLSMKLRLAYMILEGELRSCIPEYAGVIDDEEQRCVTETGNNTLTLLNATKGILEHKEPTKMQLIMTITILYNAKERLIQIKPPDLLMAGIPELSSEITELDSPDKEIYLSLLTKSRNILKSYKDKSKCIQKEEIEQCRTYLAECIRFINSQALKININTGLQIERLRTLFRWGVVSLFY